MFWVRRTYSTEYSVAFRDFVAVGVDFEFVVGKVDGG